MSAVSASPYDRHSSLLMALLWTQSSKSICLLSCGAQNGTQPDMFHQLGIGEEEHFPQPAGNAFVHQDSKAVQCRAAVLLVGPQHVLPHRITPPQVQHFAFPFVEHLEISVTHFSQGLSEKQHNHLVYPALLPSCFICKAAEDTICPIVQDIKEDVNQYWTPKASVIGKD